MPELPEVETVRRGLVPLLERQRIARAIQNRADLRWPLPERFAERLTGRRIERIGRRAKYLLLDLDGAPETLLIHLGMSGRMLLRGGEGARAQTAAFLHSAAQGVTAGKHDHVIFEMETGVTAIFNDARRFGAMDLWPTAELDAHPLLRHLGPEPLSNDFNGPALSAALADRRTAIKAALLDQRRVAGLGNIYVCEALFRAGIAPSQPAGTLDAAACATLAGTIRDVLKEAIEAGGSSLRDFHGAGGELGYFQHSFAVYGREGDPCPRCGAEIARIVQGGRSTFFCPRCQPATR